LVTLLGAALGLGKDLADAGTEAAPRVVACLHAPHADPLAFGAGRALVAVHGGPRHARRRAPAAAAAERAGSAGRAPAAGRRGPAAIAFVGEVVEPKHRRTPDGNHTGERQRSPASIQVPHLALVSHSGRAAA